MVVKQVAMELGYQLLWDADTETIKYDDTQVNYDNAATAEVLRQTNELLDAADTALIDRNQLELMLHPFFWMELNTHHHEYGQCSLLVLWMHN